jgi:protein-L-isoaspartate(D-aspartate) O-methyltransferase
MTAAPGGSESQATRSEARAAAQARATLARSLAGRGRGFGEAVQAAFRAVPRHLFLPGLPPAAAYRDEALVIKYDTCGVPVSSSSQPAMMAIMLDQLGLAAGHRVLEIGTGSGYNAAIMAHIVGPRGRVVSVDIDPVLVARAQGRLTAAGYGAVQALCADGGYGDPADAPFDRVIVTAGVWDIAPAWLDQLAPGGRLVLPLALRGIELSVALERAPSLPSTLPPGTPPPSSLPPGAPLPSILPPSTTPLPATPHWVAVSAVRCGFVQLAGAFAGPETFRPVGPSPGLYVLVDDGHAVDTGAVAMALAQPAADIGTGIAAGAQDEISDLDLWLTLTEPDTDRLTFLVTAAGQVRDAPLLSLGALAQRDPGTGQLGIVGLADVDRAAFPHEIMLRGYGPGAPALAARLISQAAAWDRLGRPAAADLRLTVWPAAPPGPAPADSALAGHVVLPRPHFQLTAGWSV